jgi:hypothetical protein
MPLAYGCLRSNPTGDGTQKTLAVPKIEPPGQDNGGSIAVAQNLFILW